LVTILAMDGAVEEATAALTGAERSTTGMRISSGIACKALALSSVFILVVLSSCKPIQTEQQKTASPLIGFLTVAKPPANRELPPPPFQQKYGGQTVVLDFARGEKPAVLGAYDDATAYSTYSQSVPPPEPCQLPNPGEIPAAATGGPQGTSKLPGNYPSTGFSGSANGGCGTWSIAICNRILGDTDPNAPVDQAEWNDIARAIGQDPNTGSSAHAGRDAYYRDKGYCVETRRFTGSAADQNELSQKVVNQKCDVKLAFYTGTPGPPSTLANGHVETVTGITAKGIQTNSWSTDGYVQIGANGGVSHSRFPIYAPGNSSVFVTYVCKCSIFDKLF
jgi:hypothetical protein